MKLRVVDKTGKAGANCNMQFANFNLNLKIYLNKRSIY